MDGAKHPGAATPAATDDDCVSVTGPALSALLPVDVDNDNTAERRAAVAAVVMQVTGAAIVMLAILYVKCSMLFECSWCGTVLGAGVASARCTYVV